ncbi:MAG: His/Gly/Thr/Pro-type tRNA ligase C-terminal domain-containing protein, partial [Bdellovibrionota bacterium]|nr:His/Gly/Thr/Pro-type tRNA ligase C-terminal domain-containing protein [Bdellovibrionota bacterium]
FADLRTAKEGDQTLDGLGTVKIKRGIEVGHIFQLGDKYTKGLDVQILDNQGKTVYPLMGCYGIGVTRIVAAAIEQNHDERGIVWPKSISPYDIHLVRLAKKKETEAIVDDIYQELRDEGFSVVYDDRKAGAGFKFKDADLLGLPICVVFGERDYLQEGAIEIIVRKTNEKIKIPKSSLISKIKELWSSL